MTLPEARSPGRPLVMGVVNVTPDSFSDGGAWFTPEAALAHGRDLVAQGDDLLVLAGPTMDLDGPVTVFRWHGAMSVEAPTVVRGDALTPEEDLPFGHGTDHAEGIGLLGAPEDGRLLVVYDSPAPERLGDDGVLADVVQLPRA